MSDFFDKASIMADEFCKEVMENEDPATVCAIVVIGEKNGRYSINVQGSSHCIMMSMIMAMEEDYDFYKDVKLALRIVESLKQQDGNG